MDQPNKRWTYSLHATKSAVFVCKLLHRYDLTCTGIEKNTYRLRAFRSDRAQDSSSFQCNVLKKKKRGKTTAKITESGHHLMNRSFFSSSWSVDWGESRIRKTKSHIVDVNFFVWLLLFPSSLRMSRFSSLNSFPTRSQINPDFLFNF